MTDDETQKLIDKKAEEIYRPDDHPPGPALPPLFYEGFYGPLWEAQRKKYRDLARAALGLSPHPCGDDR